jgi:hypothetical protein
MSSKNQSLGRHSRESGNPGRATVRSPLDPRFRGGDGKGLAQSESQSKAELHNTHYVKMSWLLEIRPEPAELPAPFSFQRN